MKNNKNAMYIAQNLIRQIICRMMHAYTMHDGRKHKMMTSPILFAVEFPFPYMHELQMVRATSVSMEVVTITVPVVNTLLQVQLNLDPRRKSVRQSKWTTQPAELTKSQ